MDQYEDFAINLVTGDIYFDSKGDIAVNWLDVSTQDRKNQLRKDIYHIIAVNWVSIIQKDTDEERQTYIKSLFRNDTRIEDFSITVEGENITIDNVELAE